MPRLTDRDFLAQRLLLIEEWWDREANAFFDLPTSAQRDLHDFYAPAEAMTDEQALAHRKAMTKAFPSLPQKAGRAFEALRAVKAGESNRLIDQSPTAKGSNFVSNGHTRRIRIKALAQPRRDPAHLARLVIKMGGLGSGRRTTQASTTKASVKTLRFLLTTGHVCRRGLTLT